MYYNNDYRYIFLHDDNDRRELARLNALSGRVIIITVVCDLAASVILLFVLKRCAGENFARWASLFCGGLFFAVLATAAVIMSVKSRRILAYSFSKLAQTPSDGLKRRLHILYARSQRAGNIMFASMVAAGIVAGIAAALIGHGIDGGPSPLYIRMMTATGISLTISVAAAFIVWTIMFAAYRRKAGPIERQLTFMSSDEGVQG